MALMVLVRGAWTSWREGWPHPLVSLLFPALLWVGIGLVCVLITSYVAGGLRGTNKGSQLGRSSRDEALVQTCPETPYCRVPQNPLPAPLELGFPFVCHCSA